MAYSALVTDVAAKFEAAPTTYNNATLHTDGLLKADQVRFSGLTFLGTSTVAALPNPNTIPAGNFYITTTGGVAYTKTFVAGESAISDGTNYSVGPNPTQVVANGGTGATTAAAARTNLDVMATADVNDRQLSKAPSNGLYFDGINDQVSLADNALFSPGDGTNDTPFSLSFVLTVDDLAADNTIWGKSDSGTTAEWILQTRAVNGFLKLWLRDQSAGVTIDCAATTLALVVGQKYHVACTYDGSGGAAAANGIALYVNGVACALNPNNNASYVSMENLSSLPRLMRDDANSTYTEGQMSSAVYWNRDLSASEVATLAANGNQVPVSDQWGNDTEILGNPGFEVWDSASNAGTWNEGALITVAQDGVNKYSGSYACHYTSSGSATTSGAAHQLRQGDLVPVGQNYASVIVKNAAAGAFSIGVNNDRFLTFDGTSLTDTSSEVTSQYPGSSLNNYRLTDLGSGWFKIDLWFLLVATSARDFVLGGTGQWYIDDASNTKAGAVLSLNPDNIDSAQWRDSSSNGLSGTITGATPLMEKRALHINAASPAADEKLLTVSTAGVEKASIDEDGDAVVQKLNIAAIPTASAGLASGDVWSNSGVLTIIA